jgi:hypothetical protein
MKQHYMTIRVKKEEEEIFQNVLNLSENTSIKKRLEEVIKGGKIIVLQLSFENTKSVFIFASLVNQNNLNIII